jgi:hypothetical protein
MSVGSNRIIINNSDTDLLITEAGQSITASGGYVDLSESFSSAEIARFGSLITLIASGTITINDGLRDYGIAEGIRLLMSIEVPRSVDADGNQYINIAGNPLDYDRKIVVHSSPRPLSPKTYTHYMGRGDCLDTSLHGEGIRFALTVTGTFGSFDFPFLSDSQLYMRGAFFGWENAAWGTEMTCEMYAGASLVYEDPSFNFLTIDQFNRIHLDMASGTYSWAANPVPTPAYDYYFQPCGFWNLNASGDSLVYDATGSGTYDLYTVERQVARFVQKMQIYGTNQGLKSLESDDVEYIPPGYFFRMSVWNPEVHDELVNGTYVTITGCQPMRLWGTFFSYRQDTLP